MKYVPLTKGKVALVDDEVFEIINQFKWYLVDNKKHRREYAATTFSGRMVLMHRLIVGALFLPVDVDHENGNGLDNQRQNLRVSTRSQNSANTRKYVGAYSSRFKGVSHRKETGKWRARIRVDGKLIELGQYDTEEDAAEAYDQAAKASFGEFARLNAA